MSDSPENSPSPNIHFRESDVEFLQQQARIWLESVLGERFDEDASLTNLLADGEILQRIATTIRKLLQKHSDGEPDSPKSLFPEASFYGKHSGKYFPYSNVDAFLKVCQKLGLTGVDLFSPPDVVEKKDIRRVCLCIRALSKKARAKQLGVPNFDNVSHTVAMPTEWVGGLRDSLRQASAASSSPSGPKSIENQETPEKVWTSPLLFKRSADSDVSVGPSPLSSSEFSKDIVKEPGSWNSVTGNGDNVTGDTLRDAKLANAISASSQFSSKGDHDLTNTEKWDMDMLRGSRRSLFGDPRLPSQNSSFETPPDAPLLFSGTDYSDSFDSAELSSSETSSNQGLLPSTKPSLLDPSRNSLKNSDSKQQAQKDPSGLASGKLSGQPKKDSNDCCKEKKSRTWVPVLAAAAVALLGVVLMIRARESPIYEVKKGDTLSEISRKTGKSNWEELVRLNPDIKNPDLIYPSERLRIRL